MLRPANLLIAAAPLALLAACTDGTSAVSAPKPAADATPVVLGQVEAREFVPEIEGIGTARALESVLVTAQASGRIEQFHFKEGARTASGAPLVRLEDEQERAELKAAQAEADQAASRNQRLTELSARGLVPRDQLEQQNQVLKSAQARLEVARVRLDQRTVHAPFAGVLGFRQQSLGALVQPGSPIVTLDQVDTLRVEFSVAEALLGDLAPGAVVEVRAAAWPDRTFKARISALGTRVDEVTRAAPVQALLDNKDNALKPGMLLTVHAQGHMRHALFVPEAAVAPENALQFVWRVGADDTAEKVAVTLGARLPGTVEVRSGLAAGERVVLEGQAQLRAGKPVRAVASPAAPG